MLYLRTIILLAKHNESYNLRFSQLGLTGLPKTNDRTFCGGRGGGHTKKLMTNMTENRSRAQTVGQTIVKSELHHVAASDKSEEASSSLSGTCNFIIGL